MAGANNTVFQIDFDAERLPSVRLARERAAAEDHARADARRDAAVQWVRSQMGDERASNRPGEVSDRFAALADEEARLTGKRAIRAPSSSSRMVEAARLHDEYDRTRPRLVDPVEEAMAHAPRKQVGSPEWGLNMVGEEALTGYAAAGLGELFKGGVNAVRTSRAALAARAASAPTLSGGLATPNGLKAGYIAVGDLSKSPVLKVGKAMFGAPDTGNRRRAILELTKDMRRARGPAIETREALEKAQTEYIAQAQTQADAAMDAFDRGTSALKEQAFAAARQTGATSADAATIAQALQADRVSVDGAKLLEQIENAGAAAEAQIRAGGVFPELEKAASDALATFSRKTTELTMKKAAQQGVNPFKKNDQSHLWRIGKPRTEADPLLAAVPEGGGFTRQFTSAGSVPRAVSGALRLFGREFLPVSTNPDTPLGAFAHWLTSPNGVYTGMLALSAYGTVGHVGHKLGLWDSPDEKLVRSQEGKQPAPASTGPVKAQPTVDQVVDRHTIARIKEDFAKTATTNRAAAVKMRDTAFANLPPSARTDFVETTRARAFEIRNPGQSYEALQRSEKGRQFIQQFNDTEFSSRSPEEWLTTDMGEYAKGVESQRYGGF